jgi:hypothetical protein
MAAFAVQIKGLGGIDRRTVACGFMTFRERDPQVDQFLDSCWSLSNTEVDNGLMTKASTGDMRVFFVFLEAIFFRPDRGDSSLGISGRALFGFDFGGDNDLAGVCKLKGGAEARNSGTQD